LQSLYVAKKINKAKAYNVANQVYSLALQELIFDIAKLNANNKKLMLNKKSNDDSIIKNVVKNNCENNELLKINNASSSYTSLFTLTKECY